MTGPDVLGKLRTAVVTALATPAGSAAWDEADDALEAARADPGAEAALLAAGAGTDDLDCLRYVEIGRALERIATGGAARDGVMFAC